jgi:hypothetical protein
VLGEQAAVLAGHEGVVVSVCHERRLRDRGEADELRGVGDPPARDRLQLRVAGRDVRGLVSIDLARADASKERRCLGRLSSDPEKNSLTNRCASRVSWAASE